jgi:protein TonB
MAPQPEPALAASSATASPAPVAAPVQARPAPVAAPVAAPAQTGPAPVAAQVQTRLAPQASAGIPATDAAAKSGNEMDTGTLEQYKIALIIATRRFKRYPPIAMEKGWQGRVNVHMVIGANGVIASASIKTGSGHEVLDNQALDMLKKGNAMVPIPASLRGREFSIEVPVIFNLENPNS